MDKLVLDKIMEDYAYALSLLDGYDKNEILISSSENTKSYHLNHTECIEILNYLKDDQTSAFFGNIRDKSFQSSIESVFQTYEGNELYPSLEEKAIKLLYLIIKNHSFSDGNKRIGLIIFLYFLAKSGALLKNEHKILSDSFVVPLVLMIAESNSIDKNVLTNLCVSLLQGMY